MLVSYKLYIHKGTILEDNDRVRMLAFATAFEDSGASLFTTKAYSPKRFDFKTDDLN